MRHVILLDNLVPDTEFEQWRVEDTSFWRSHIGVTPTYEVIRTDFTTYPTYIDSDGDVRPTDAYLQALTDMVVSKYGRWGTDFVMVMIHQDNWRSTKPGTSKGIWGTNYSYAFGDVCLDYCRWDKRKPANTFGVAYHERHHSFDAIIKQEVGVKIEPLLAVAAYDRDITHGGREPWKYIRYQENLDSLRVMKPYLQKAFAIRKERHEKRQKNLETIIDLASQVVYLLKKQLNKKHGVKL